MVGNAPANTVHTAISVAKLAIHVNLKSVHHHKFRRA